MTQVSYTIDHDDRIISVNTQWNEFAIANDAPELNFPGIINRPIWDFITDFDTTSFYREMISKVRRKAALDFNFRCDSPSQRRLMRMTMIPRENDRIEFISEILESESRAVQNLIARHHPHHSESLVVMCSWCKKVKISDALWHEIEEAIVALKIFEREMLPKISHGMCGSCFDHLKYQFGAAN